MRFLPVLTIVWLVLGFLFLGANCSGLPEIYNAEISPQQALVSPGDSITLEASFVWLGGRGVPPGDWTYRWTNTAKVGRFTSSDTTGRVGISTQITYQVNNNGNTGTDTISLEYFPSGNSPQSGYTEFAFVQVAVPLSPPVDSQIVGATSFEETLPGNAPGLFTTSWYHAFILTEEEGFDQYEFKLREEPNGPAWDFGPIGSTRLISTADSLYDSQGIVNLLGQDFWALADSQLAWVIIGASLENYDPNNTASETELVNTRIEQNGIQAAAFVVKPIQ